MLNLSSWCPLVVVSLFLTVPWVCLQFVIVVFPDYTHLLFLELIEYLTSKAHSRCLDRAFAVFTHNVGTQTQVSKLPMFVKLMTAHMR